MMLLHLSALFIGAVWAQRPSDSSLCDYYAKTLYGTSTNVTQFRLIEDIVTMAFGGPYTVTTDVSPNLTGIWNPGNFEGLNVNLRPWFDRLIDSTNLNNAPIGINWLDGGLQPLQDYLTGTTQDVIVGSTTNQARLFQHWFQAFGHLFGCTQTFILPTLPGSSGPLSLAYVHKYMNLNHTDIGHFINQFSLAAQHFGFSTEDAETFATNLNSQYNVACAPPITLNAQQGPQLLSLCQATNCPLAEPSPDCPAYANLGPSGIGNGTVAPSTAAPSPSATSSAAAKPSESGITPTPSSKISAGAIAGITIGSIAVAFMGVIAAILLFRRRRVDNSGDGAFSRSGKNMGSVGTQPMSSSAYYSPAPTDPHMSNYSNPAYEIYPRQPPAEMDTSRVN